MSVILLSDASGQRNSDEHRAFDLSAGRTVTRLRLTPPEGQDSIPPTEKLPRTQTSAPKSSKKDEEPPREIPASTYLPGSG